MELRQAIKRRISALSARFQPTPPTDEGARFDAGDGGFTGSMGQATLLPGYMLRKANGEQVAAYLKESSRANYQFGFDAPFNKDTPFIPPSEDPLKEWDLSTREYVLSQCHAAYQRNPLANAAVEYTADFVIGEGFNITYKNEQVKDILEAFIDDEDNQLRKYERQAVIDLQVDGELILRYFKGKSEDGTGGMVSVVPQRPWELEYIDTEDGNFRRPVYYSFQRELRRGDNPTGGLGTKSEQVPADEILHIAINNHAYELRGRPDLYRILPWLRADTEFLQNRARQNYWRGALLWLVRVISGGAGQVAAVAARWSKPPTAGSVAVESGNVEVEPLTNPVNAGDASEDGRQIKLRNIIGMRMAEYMFADGQNANLASATAQQLPAITRFTAYQTVMVERVWYPLFKKALNAAIEAGLLPNEVEEQSSDGEPVTDDVMPDTPPQPADTKTGMPKPLAMQPDKLMPKQGKARIIDTMEAFEVTYSPISQTDLKTLAEAMDIATTKGWVSNETATGELGYDYTIEQKKIKREQVQDMAAIAAGIKPPPPEMIPPPEPNTNAANQ